MNNAESVIYEILKKITEREIETFDDDDEFIQKLDMDSLTITIFMVEIESIFDIQIPWYKFNKNITFGQFKQLLQCDNNEL